MKSLIGTQPTAVRHLTEATLFYFGSQTPDINLLPGKAKFEIVYSPRESFGWEFVSYQWFSEKNGIFVLERRALEPDEIQYFERLMLAPKKSSGTQPLISSASI